MRYTLWLRLWGGDGDGDNGGGGSEVTVVVVVWCVGGFLRVVLLVGSELLLSGEVLGNMRSLFAHRYYHG